MSVSNKTFKNTSIDLSHKFRGEEAGYHISNKIKSLSNPLDLNDSTDTIDSETIECMYNRDSGEEKNEEKDYRNQMIDLPKLLRQLSLARVVLKRLPVLTEATKLQTTDNLTSVDVAIVDQNVDANAPQDEDVRRSEYMDNDGESHADSGAIEDTCDIVDEAEKKVAAMSTTSCNRQKPADLIKRYCPKCKTLAVAAGVYKKQLCTKCETPMTYKCARCNKQYNNSESMIRHSYYCSRKTIHSCSRCKYTTKYTSNLHRHVREVHEVADKSTTSCNRQKPADLIKRYCPKCKTLAEDASVCLKQLCTKCETPMTYQCAGCDKQYNHSESMIRHSYYCSSQTIQSCSHCDFTTKYPANLHRHVRIVHEVADKSTTSCNRQKPADLTKRHCPKCKTLAEDASVYLKQLCTKCGTPLDFLCVRCDKQCSNYQSMIRHLDSKCNTQNLDLRCPECDYRTHAKTLMTKHLSFCLSGINFICGLCEHSTRLRQNLFRHMFSMHKDIFNVDCYQCKTKPNKCEQCKNMVPFCETCYTGFSSTDRFEEHQKSCKQPVLECKYCPFKTIDNRKLRKHIKLEHLSGSISQAKSTQD